MRRMAIVLVLLPMLADAAVQDITYPSPKGGVVPAYLVTASHRAQRGPAIIFMHWGLGDRHTFLDESKTLSEYGVTSLLIDAPFNRPDATKDENEDLLHAVADVKAGIDFLSKRSDIDAKRIGYAGLSYGAHVGALLAAQEPRLRALVLAGGLASNADAEHNPALAEYDAEKWIAKPHTAPVFLQFAIRDEYITRDQADRFIKAASQPAMYKRYEGNHAFNASARADRDAWLAGELGFTIPGSEYQQVSPAPVKSQIAKFGVVFELPGMQQIGVKSDIVFKPGMKLDVYYPFTLAAKDRVPFVIAVNGQSDNPEFMRGLRTVRFTTTFARALAVRTMRIVVVPDIRSAKAGDPADDLRDAIRYVTAHADELQIDPTQFAIVTRSAGYSYGLRAAEGAKAAAVWYGNLKDAPVVKDVPLLVVTAQYDFWYDAAAAKRYVDATGARQIHLPDADHGFEMFDDLEQSRDAFLQTAMFLREHLPIRRNP